MTWSAQEHQAPRRRRRGWLWLLLVAFVVVPLVEVYVLIQVGQVIGGWQTLGLVILAGVLGTWLMKREGGRAWVALRDALASGRMPAREIADGALILIGGTLMLTPGFLSDIVAVFLILPVTRPVARRALTRVVSRKLTGGVMGQSNRPGPRSDGSVVQGEVLDD
ncbi:FxsA family protein [Nocardioides pacificus]